MRSRVFYVVKKENIFNIKKVFSVKHLTFLKIYCKIDLIEKIISRSFVKNPFE